MESAKRDARDLSQVLLSRGCYVAVKRSTREKVSLCCAVCARQSPLYIVELWLSCVNEAVALF